MQDIKTKINSIGILLTIVGVWIVYRNSPINTNVIDGGSATDDHSHTESNNNRANRLLKCGVYIVMFGSILQLVSNFLPIS